MPRSSEDRWKEIDAMRKRNDAYDAQLAAMRKKNEEDRAELKKWEESIKEVPVELRMAAQRAAARPKKYTFDEFKAYLKTIFNWQNLALITPYLVYGIYLMLRQEQEEEPAPPSLLGQIGLLDNSPILSPCANESVVDSVFAKAEADKRGAKQPQ